MAVDAHLVLGWGLCRPTRQAERSADPLVIERHRRRLRGRARRITIDLDPTDDPTHGAQQLTFFNGHYDSRCYLPCVAFVSFDREVEQYLCAAVLRPGKAQAPDGTLGVLCRLLALLRCAFSKARFLVRVRRRRTSTSTPAIARARGLVSAR